MSMSFSLKRERGCHLYGLLRMRRDSEHYGTCAVGNSRNLSSPYKTVHEWVGKKDASSTTPGTSTQGESSTSAKQPQAAAPKSPEDRPSKRTNPPSSTDDLPSSGTNATPMRKLRLGSTAAM